MEPARAPVPGLGVVGDVHATQRSRAAARTRSRRPDRAAADATQHPAGSAGSADLRVDRPDLPPAPAERLVGLLRRDAAPSPTARTTPALTCVAGHAERRRRPGIWNPLPYFDTVSNDNQLGNIQSVDELLRGREERARCPRSRGSSRRGDVSEHPPSPVSAGQSYVTSLVNAVMSSPDWNSTAIFLAWDDWGGFYDHVVPPVVDAERLRAARARHRDQPVRQARLHRSPDAELRRVRRSSSRTTSSAASASIPKTDGRPDPRPDVRENAGDPRRPHLRLRLHAGAATADAATGPPGHDVDRDRAVLAVHADRDAGNGQATVSWQAPDSDGGARIQGYVVTPYLDGTCRCRAGHVQLHGDDRRSIDRPDERPDVHVHRRGAELDRRGLPVADDRAEDDRRPDRSADRPVAARRRRGALCRGNRPARHQRSPDHRLRRHPVHRLRRAARTRSTRRPRRRRSPASSTGRRTRSKWPRSTRTAPGPPRTTRARWSSAPRSRRRTSSRPGPSRRRHALVEGAAD